VDTWSLDLLQVPLLSDHMEEVDDHLAGACVADSPNMFSPSLRMVAAGGKRLRPALTIATADLGKVFDGRVIAAACAVELVQVGSLVHDDIFDQARTRRGIPTINAVEGPDEALVAGTFLLARAAAKAAFAGPRVAVEVARTVSQLCVGQTIETLHLFDLEQPIDRYMSTIEAKTAALFACACRVGAITGELPEDQVDSLGEFGRNFGMAFQLIDDVLDLIGDPDLLGKPTGNDLRSGVLTLPVLLNLSEPSGGDLRALLVRKNPEDLEQAARMVIASGRIEETVELARQYGEAASASIRGIPGSQSVALSLFGSSYVDWALERFCAN